MQLFKECSVYANLFEKLNMINICLILMFLNIFESWHKGKVFYSWITVNILIHVSY